MFRLLVVAAVLAATASSSVVCPNHQVECPQGSTCCQLSTGQYGCCSLPNAICCADHEHCCPHDSKCDIDKGMCIRKMSNPVPWHTKTPAKPINEKFVICPDKQSMCAVGSTCCKMASGKFGCCPLSKAVCCSDHIHCCAEGSSCELVGGICMTEDGYELPIREMQPTKPYGGDYVICPGEQFLCPDGNTCCRLHSGAWGCCPVPRGVCCVDGKHCCPTGYKCDIEHGTCSKNVEGGFPWLAVVSGMANIPEKTYTVCPGGQTKCPITQNCCQVGNSYKCCPFPACVCCPDRKHCCPKGYTCDLKHKACKKDKDEAVRPDRPADSFDILLGSLTEPEGDKKMVSHKASAAARGAPKAKAVPKSKISPPKPVPAKKAVPLPKQKIPKIPPKLTPKIPAKKSEAKAKIVPKKVVPKKVVPKKVVPKVVPKKAVPKKQVPKVVPKKVVPKIVPKKVVPKKVVPKVVPKKAVPKVVPKKKVPTATLR